MVLTVFSDEKTGGGKLPDWAKKSKSKSKSKSSSSAFDPRSNSSDLGETFKSEEFVKYDEYSLDKAKADILSPTCVDILNTHIHKCYSIINNYGQLLSVSDKKNILTKYSRLTKQQYKPDIDIHKQRLRLLGPQPVTLNHQNIDADEPINIIHGYAVTEKADGYRAQLLITDNRGYLITSKLNVIYTGIKFPDVNGDWLFDGEYITKNKNKEDIKLYMIFDVYYNGQEPGVKPAFNHIWLSDDDRIVTRSQDY